MTFDDVRRADDLDDAFGKCGRLLPGIGCQLQDDEFIAADAGYRVALAHAAEQPAGNLAQQGVADGMAERVVDGLEAVEVEAQQSDVLVAAARFQRRFQALAQQDAIRQIGQRIVMRHVGDARLVAMALGEVADGVDLVAAHPGAERAADHLHGDHAIVGGTQQRFSRLRTLGRLEVRALKQIAGDFLAV